MSMRISRASFLKCLGAFGIATLLGKIYSDWERSKQIPCRILGPSVSLGHMIRDGKFTKLSSNILPTNTKVTIVGGGMAGLSAAWWFKKHGFSDFTLLEMENNVGGNSSSGKNQFSAYPWGAHYVPVANKESTYVRMLFEELGIIEGHDQIGQPIYNELYMCHEPQERLLKDGSFQEGMVPRRGLQPRDQDEIARFFNMISKFRAAYGTDGKPAFAIPLDLSSQDIEFTCLDHTSMSTWLAKNEFYSKPLLWYVNYCCRDDYGSSIEHVSAWAGIHYFAGRRGVAANSELNSLVTWPEGNGFIVNKLKNQLDKHIMKGSVVTAIAQNNGVNTTYVDRNTNNCLSLKSDFLIFAAPRFLASHIVTNYPKHDLSDQQDLVYAPWLVANISLKKIPQARGTAIAWDNVNYSSNSLGYVVATHQNISTREGPTVVTYYYPLSGKDPIAARKELLATTSEAWSKLIVDDLEKMHSNISSEILSIDVWPWGHGMIRPSVGFIWGNTRNKMKQNNGNIFFAHSDMSGISNFEEAQYQGIEAAKKVLTKLKIV